MAIASINGFDLYYEIHGSGPPLLLIAGLASDSQSWLPVTQKLAARCQVIAFDNRGSGRTRPMDGALSISAMADDCIGLLRHLRLPSAHLLGHSMGGFIALECALRYPAQVDSLVLAATAARNLVRNNDLFADFAAERLAGATERWFRSLFYWLFTERFFEDRRMLAAALEFALNYPYPQSAAAFLNQVQALRDFDCTAQLARVAARTLVLAGQEDLLFPVPLCQKLAAEISGAQFRVIENAAHTLHMENPEAFVRAVLEFLLPGEKIS
jgi:pimeloyl-ACP methyl ester carboxylesterase